MPIIHQVAARASLPDLRRAPHFAMERAPPGDSPTDYLPDVARTILENSAAIIYLKDLEGRYLFVNHRFEQMLRVTSSQIMGGTDFDVHAPEVAERIRANDALVIRGGKAQEIEETVFVGGSDEPSYYISVKEPLFDAEGRPIAVCGISTDMTPWKRAQEAARLGEERYRSLVEATAAIVWATPPDGSSTPEGTARWREFTGQGEEEAEGLGWLRAVHPDDRPRTEQQWVAAVACGGSFEVEHRVRGRDGAYRIMRARAVPVRDVDGSVREWVGAHVDVTDREVAERALRESRQRHEAAMIASGTGTYRWDLATSAIEWDDQMRVLFGVGPDHVPSFDDVLSRLHPEDRERMEAALTLVARGEASADGQMEFRVVQPDGSMRWLTGKGRMYHDAEGRPTHIVGGCHDVTPLKEAEARLAHRANHDTLTGMPNRALLQATMEQRVAAGSRFAFLLLDLDRFKEINDTFGHGHGDAVLRELRPRLGAAVRGPRLIARLGGDEFGILLEGAGLREAVEAARSILADLVSPIHVRGHDLEVGASVGVALFPDQGRDVASIIRMADVAMYAAKRSRSGWAIYQPGQDRACARNLTMVGELRQAIESDQLRINYQPKVDLRSMIDAGVEALVRWQHPREGLLAPDEFIPVAEETGLVHPLSLWVLDRALRDRRAWAARGVDSSVSVNLAADSLQDPSLDAIIADLLARHDAPARRLTIEVTETGMMRNPTRARTLLTRLHDMGVRISIDDFGTGYSSLAYLKELPVDEVKVDRSFVKDAATSQRDACIVRSVIDLGHNLGLRVVAEGVEDEATLELLRSWGCDLAQGWLLGRPSTADSYLRGRRPLVPAHRP
ncbi:EAL domain-containing protein [Paludisphaera sp.]|uniref:sensor domain-containing protein n=1 Tax=Paludisphaera sp. TaxID=2017432 RepID=UPI00301D7DEA